MMQIMPVRYGVNLRGADPFSTSVVSLLHFNGIDGSTTFTDETGKVWTPSGNAQIDTAQSIFGGASGLFDGTGDFITTPVTSDFAYGTGDFTWEIWLRLNSVAGNQYILDHDVNEGVIQYVSGSLKYYNINTGIGSPLYTTGGGALSVNTWYHIAISRAAGVTRFFVDGDLKSSGSDSFNYTSSGLSVGRFGGGGNTLNGWLDDLRITKGVARYTANFTPPSMEFPNP